MSLETTKIPINFLPPPIKVPGMPVLGNARDFLARPMEFFLECYHKYGPVFNIAAASQKYTVMAGLEANLFMAQDKAEHFSSAALFGDFARQIGSANFLVAIDGPHHSHLRKIMQRGYSKSGMAPHLDRFMDITREHTRNWKVGQTIFARDEFQRLVTEQLGTALTNHSSKEYFESIRIYLDTLLQLSIKYYPRIMLSLPRYQNARRKVMEFAQMVLEEHRNPGPNDHHDPDLIDDLLAALDWNGDPLKEDDLLAAAIGPFFAGMHTVANTMGFMIYAILKQPDVYERIQAEVDEHFANGIPPWRDLPQLETLYAATIETLRRYPVAPFTPRGIIKPFTFAGHHIAAGQTAMIVNGLTHFLPEYFPDPWTFNVERYIRPRQEHKQGQGVFVPYTLGPHTCLGAGVAEIQLMVTVGALIKSVRIELENPNYEIITKLMPIPGPDPKFKFRVVEHRS